MPLVAEKILMVDDDPRILTSTIRLLRGKLNMVTADNGAKGLQVAATKGPFAVVVSDYKMPGIDGVTFLSKIRKHFPETTRILLTGYADIDNAIRAVNESDLFRFLTKPCDSQLFLKTVLAGVKQYRLERGEKELLEKTLQGSIKVLTDILGLINPQALGRTTRISYYVTEIARAMGQPHSWELEAAAMLSQIGFLTLPGELLTKVLKGFDLDSSERKLYRQYPAFSSELIKPIPRMEVVSQTLAYQEKAYDGSGPPDVGLSGDDIPLGARILKTVMDFDKHVYAGATKGKALEALKGAAHLYDPKALGALEEVLGVEAKFDFTSLCIKELKPGMILTEDVMPKEGDRRLLAKGVHLSSTLIMKIRNCDLAFGVAEPINVIVPLARQKSNN